MRAIVLKEFEYKSKIDVSDEAFHHLVKVVRSKVGNEFLVINGKGSTATYKIDVIEKKKLTAQKISGPYQKEKSLVSDLFLGVPKKDFFESILRSAVEMGVMNILLYQSEFSQWKYEPSKRIDTIIEGAMAQSNNCYWPNIEIIKEIKDLNGFQYKRVFNFTTFSNTTDGDIESIDKSLCVIGPESGFSKHEEEQIRKLNGIVNVHLPLPIMRAINAVPACLGYILGRVSH